MQNEFIVGDIVKIKSGGPDMTVQVIPAQTLKYYRCQWFAGKKLEFGLFPAGSLEFVVQEGK
jgi:uncharacterized protein YodC (DUF2158 family)